MSDHPDRIPAPTPTLADLHRRWMHARVELERAERAAKAAEDARAAAYDAATSAAEPLAELLLADVQPARNERRTRRRTVAIAGEVLAVSDGGAEHPGEYRITPIAVDLVPLD